MADVHLRYLDAVNIKVEADRAIIMEISDYLTFYADNYKFHPKYRSRMWDGKIRLLNGLTCVTYAGLAKRIKKFCDERHYTMSFDKELLYENVKIEQIEEFLKTLNLPHEPREYQIRSIHKCIVSNRRTLLSPTSSGKSLIIYALTQWYDAFKALIIVPTVGLVKQMESDFREYGYTGKIHASTDGLSKDNDIDADMVISTWQSLNNGKSRRNKAWYRQFGLVIGDEAHHAKATSLIQILSSMDHCKYRFGTTGTLDDHPLNQATIEGLFGPQYKSISTKEMMDKKYATKLKIKCLVLKYPEEIRKQNKSLTYQEEIDFLVNFKPRNTFIKNLTKNLKGNKLLFFRLKDHGQNLYQSLSEASGGNVFYIDGGVHPDERERMRKAIEEESDATLIGSLGTTSTGTNIKKLHHMIAGHPSKSKIKVLQSIGRMLRLHESKEETTLYDIVDDMTYKSRKNYTLNHFLERIKIYDKEQFDVEIHYVEMK